MLEQFEELGRDYVEEIFEMPPNFSKDSRLVLKTDDFRKYEYCGCYITIYSDGRKVKSYH